MSPNEDIEMKEYTYSGRSAWSIVQVGTGLWRVYCSDDHSNAAYLAQYADEYECSPPAEAEAPMIFQGTALEAIRQCRKDNSIEWDELEEITSPLEFTHCALIQNGYAVYGVGETEEECRDDASKWLEGGKAAADHVDAFASMSAMRYRTEHGGLAIVPCTAAFHDYVRQHGTTTWEESDDGICLPSELAEE
jgi:hypothetical protein